MKNTTTIDRIIEMIEITPEEDYLLTATATETAKLDGVPTPLMIVNALDDNHNVRKSLAFTTDGSRRIGLFYGGGVGLDTTEWVTRRHPLAGWSFHVAALINRALNMIDDERKGE